MCVSTIKTSPATSASVTTGGVSLPSFFYSSYAPCRYMPAGDAPPCRYKRRDRRWQGSTNSVLFLYKSEPILFHTGHRGKCTVYMFIHTYMRHLLLYSEITTRGRQTTVLCFGSELRSPNVESGVCSFLRTWTLQIYQLKERGLYTINEDSPTLPSSFPLESTFKSKTFFCCTNIQH